MPPLPPPQSLQILSCISLITSMVILILSLFDLGFLSLWINPPSAFITLVYHFAVLLLARKRPDSDPMFSIATIAFAYILALVWLGAFVIMVLMAWGRETEPDAFSLNPWFPANSSTQRLQLIFTPLESFILGDLAIRSTILRRKPYWRPMPIFEG